jgi:chromosomal replication initiator protein
MESYEILWNNALIDLQNSMLHTAYSTFIKPLTAVDLINGKLIIWCKTNLVADTVNKKYADNLRSAISKASNGVISDYEFVVGADKSTANNQTKKVEVPVQNTFTGSTLNPKFTFDSFVVGSSNELIYAAAKSVAENPGDSFNPLFIYGGTGLGKTHILMAIANELKIKQPSKTVLYATCEQFTNQLIDSISKGKNNSAEFRSTFRGVDILLIDDIQFLSGKQSTQSEFFHTFNELIMQNKQIVLASDRPPHEIEVLEERLRTRFEGGLLADVQKPDLETRIAILKKKAEEKKVIVDIKVLTYIAERGDEDIRSLIGKLTKVIFASQLHEKPINIELVNEALKESVTDTQEEVKIDDIINCVADFYKIKKTDMLGKKKNKEFVEPRQICIYLVTELLNLPLVTIGQKMGGRDHATVIYARDKIADLIKLDIAVATQVNDLKNLILKK